MDGVTLAEANLYTVRMAGLEVPGDEELLASSRRDPNQFGVFYDRHAPAVLAFCARRVGSLDLAADLTAEVFAAAYAKRTEFHHSGAPARAWLFGIARRQIGTFHRRRRIADRYRKRFGIARTDVGDEFERIDTLVDLETILPSLNNALAELPNGQQRAVRLRIVDRLSYQEVARRLGCSEGAARVRVSRALSRLAESLEEP